MIAFQALCAVFILVTLGMTIAVPVAYATPQNWEQSKPLLFVGSGLWVALVVVLTCFNLFVS